LWCAGEPVCHRYDEEIIGKEPTLTQQRKIPIYPIAGETVGERKRTVRKLLAGLGFTVDAAQVTQTNGMLSVRWEPPFSDEFVQSMTRLASYGSVFFFPDPSEARIACIDLVFEQGGGLFLEDLIIKRPVILESLDRLPVLLSDYVETVQEIERRRANATGMPEPEPELETEQMSLW
jgi:hypothetical protein